MVLTELMFEWYTKNNQKRPPHTNGVGAPLGQSLHTNTNFARRLDLRHSRTMHNYYYILFEF